MSEITAGELWARRDALENDAALLLGHMLFESQTKSVEMLNLKAKLDELAKHVATKLPSGSKRRRAYENWIERANSLRQQRNHLVHGRWGVDAHKNKVVNVIGLPTSSAQKSIEYTIEELAEVAQTLRELQRELARLGEQWPL